MSIFVRPTAAPRPKTKDVRTVSLALTAIFVIMAVTQLFTFEKFPEVIAQMWLPADELASVWAAVIVTLEVAAIPFLLGMRLSIAARIVSMAAGWLAVGVWFAVSIWQNVSGNVIANSGFFGDTVTLSVGWWSIFLSMALGILIAWASWGMWPLSKKKGAK